MSRIRQPHGIIYNGSYRDWENGGLMGTLREYPTPGAFAVAAVRFAWDEGLWYPEDGLQQFDVVPSYLAMRCFYGEDWERVSAFYAYLTPRRGATPGWWIQR